MRKGNVEKRQLRWKRIKYFWNTFNKEVRTHVQ